MHFNNSGSADSDCSDGSATLIQFDTAAHLNNGFDNLTNVSDDNHGALSVSTSNSLHTAFQTAGTETSETDINFVGDAGGKVTRESWRPGVITKPQILTFTPANVSPEGGVRFTSQLGVTSYFYETTAAHHSVKEIVEYLQPNMDGNADFTCTEDDTKIECTATNDQENSFGASTLDNTEPSVSGNIDTHINENTGGVVVDIPNTITITDADPILSYSIINTSPDHDKFSINSSTGELSLVSPLNYESPTSADGDNVYEVGVNVSDEAGNEQGVAIQITVDDVDEAPVIGNSNIGSRDENLAVGTVIFDVNDFYTHNDNDGDGDPITYAITGGNTGNVFTMDPNTGVITLAAPLDYETTTSYHLTYSGTSTTGANPALTGNGGFTMAVNNIPERSRYSRWKNRDDDGDGKSNGDEGLNTDTDGDGVKDYAESDKEDADGDGIDDEHDPIFNETSNQKNGASDEAAEATLNSSEEQASEETKTEENEQEGAAGEGQSEETINPGSQCMAFVNYHKIGDTGEEVQRIQQFLKDRGFFTFYKTTQYFGPITKRAVIAFQNAYKEQTLAPWGLSQGTGYWGGTSISTANNLMECSQ